MISDLWELCVMLYIYTAFVKYLVLYKEVEILFRPSFRVFFGCDMNLFEECCILYSLQVSSYVRLVLLTCNHNTLNNELCIYVPIFRNTIFTDKNSFVLYSRWLSW